MQRAYSLLEIKSFDEEQRLITGVASDPQTDRMGDIVESLGAKYELSIPLLLYHDSKKPVGRASLSKDERGIPFVAKLPKIAEPGVLRDRVEEAWQSVKHGLIRGTSIGFRPNEGGVEFMESGGLRFTDYEILELSLVAIPANVNATIQTIKEFASRQETSLQGPKRVDDTSTSGPRPNSTTQARVKATTAETQVSVRVTPMKNISEKIASFEATRAAKAGERKAIMEKSGDAGETLDQAQKEKYDALSAEIKELDETITRFREIEAEEKATAVTVTKEPERSAAVRDPNAGRTNIVSVTPNRDKGIGMARVVIAKMVSFIQRGQISAIDVAKQRWPDDSAVHLTLKAAVGAGTSLDSTFAAPLAYATDLPGEFIAFLRPRTIIGRIPGLNQVPFNVRMVGQSTGGTAGWVGQGKPKPLTKQTFAEVTLGIAKIAAITVIAEELAMLSSPSAEAAVRNDLAAAVIAKQDADFVNPAVAAVSNVSPASITNGLVALSSAGTSADNVRTDLGVLMKTFLDDNLDPTTGFFIMPNSLCLALSLMVNSLGQAEFPGLTVAGGTLAGLPVIGSQHAALTGGPGNLVILGLANEILLADDGVVTIDVSNQASLEMSDAPTQDGVAGSGASLVSLWQSNLLGIKAERHINWKKRRAEAVAYMDDVNWGSIGSPA